MGRFKLRYNNNLDDTSIPLFSDVGANETMTFRQKLIHYLFH